MKTAVVFLDDRMQMVLTPETDAEEKMIALVGRETKSLKVQGYRGGFYRCNGGWDREAAEDKSLIITVDFA